MRVKLAYSRDNEKSSEFCCERIRRVNFRALQKVIIKEDMYYVYYYHLAIRHENLARVHSLCYYFDFCEIPYRYPVRRFSISGKRIIIVYFVLYCAKYARARLNENESEENIFQTVLFRGFRSRVNDSAKFCQPRSL